MICANSGNILKGRDELLSFPHPFLLPSGWNEDVMARTRATLLVQEDKGHTIGNGLKLLGHRAPFTRLNSLKDHPKSF